MSMLKFSGVEDVCWNNTELIFSILMKLTGKTTKIQDYESKKKNNY